MITSALDIPSSQDTLSSLLSRRDKLVTAMARELEKHEYRNNFPKADYRARQMFDALVAAVEEG